MRRCVLITSLCVALSAAVSADVRTDQKVQFQLGGAIGKLVNMPLAPRWRAACAL